MRERRYPPFRPSAQRRLIQEPTGFSLGIVFAPSANVADSMVCSQPDTEVFPDATTVERTIDAEDLELLKLTDDVDEALDHIQRYAMERFRLRPRPFKPSSLLGEPRALESAVTVDVIPSSDSMFGRGVAGS